MIICRRLRIYFFNDDTLVFYELEESIMLNLKCVLSSFQTVYGLNINLAKSEFVSLSDGRDDTRLARMLRYKTVKLPIKYLGLTIKM